MTGVSVLLVGCSVFGPRDQYVVETIFSALAIAFSLGGCSSYLNATGLSRKHLWYGLVPLGGFYILVEFEKRRAHRARALSGGRRSQPRRKANGRAMERDGK